jgi:hypothetical protein
VSSIRYRPHNIHPRQKKVRLVIVYKNFAANKGVSHIGLGVSALQNAKMLRAAGFIVEIWPITNVEQLKDKLAKDKELAKHKHHVPITHVDISAPWIKTNALAELVHHYLDIDFTVVTHSNVAFLQADPNALRMLKEELELQLGSTNFFIGSNSARFAEWWEQTYGAPVVLLPNMYFVDERFHRPKHWTGGALKIGAFCAIRPYKNLLTAAAAALQIGEQLRVQELEFFINAGRTEGGGETISRAIREMYSNHRRAKLVEVGWQAWPQFRKTVGSMDLLMQPSYTESFNMVTADGIVEGVPSVVSAAIDWVPPRWIADFDSASDIADVGISLLHNPHAAQNGLRFLIKHNNNALRLWKQFLMKESQF